GLTSSAESTRLSAKSRTQFTGHARSPKPLFPPRAAEAASAAFSGVKIFDHLQLRLHHRRKNELRHAILILNDHRVFAMIDNDDFYFAAIIGVDRTGRIQYRDPVANRPTAARARLNFIPLGNRETQSC